MSTMGSESKRAKTSKSCSESGDNDDTIEESVDKDAYNLVCPLTYDIWRLIFKYLNGRDLSTASMVCRTWKEAIESELALHAPQYLMEEVFNFRPSNLNTIIEQIKVKPKVALCFYENTWWRNQIIEPDEEDCFCGHLPRICDVIYVQSPITDVRVKTQKDIRKNADAACCLFFPHLRNFDSKVFYETNESILEDKAIEILSNNILQHNGNAKKCLITFCNDDAMSHMHELLDTLKKNIDKSSLSLVGGRVDDLYICKFNEKTKTHDCKKKAALVVMSISKPGMESWSIVLKRSCYKEKSMIGALEEFREKIKLQKHSFAVMFGCCARMKRKNIEMSAFKGVFPSVPLIGAYGSEEYGVNTLDYNPKSKNKNFYTNYSTIFTVITYS